MDSLLYHSIDALVPIPQRCQGSTIWMLILGISWYLLHFFVSFVNVTSQLVEVVACHFASSEFLEESRVTPLDNLRCLAIVFDIEDIKQISEIDNLVIWLSNIGIKYVSLYDAEGVLKNCEANFKKLAKQDSAPSSILTLGKMSIELLSLSDGKEGIYKAASFLFSKYFEDGTLKGDQFTEAHIDNALETVGYAGPPPDLLLVFGPARCHFGFPPWRLPYTEILYLGPLHSMNFVEIMKAFYDFSTKHQNYGT